MDLHSILKHTHNRTQAAHTYRFITGYHHHLPTSHRQVRVLWMWSIPAWGKVPSWPRTSLDLTLRDIGDGDAVFSFRHPGLVLCLSRQSFLSVFHRCQPLCQIWAVEYSWHTNPSKHQGLCVPSVCYVCIWKQHRPAVKNDYDDANFNLVES